MADEPTTTTISPERQALLDRLGAVIAGGEPKREAPDGVDAGVATISPERQALLDQLGERGAENLSETDRGEVGEPITPQEPGPTDEQLAMRQQILAALRGQQEEKAQAGPISPVMGQILRATGGPLGTIAEAAMNLPGVGPAARELFGVGPANLARTLATGALATTAGVANYWDVGRTDNLVGWSLPDVKALRDNLVKEQQGIQAQLEEKVNSGAAGDLGQVPDLSLQNAQFQAQIDEANGILASGKVKTLPDAGLNAFRSYHQIAGLAASAIAAQGDEARRALIPTTEQLDASPVGQFLQGVGTLGTLAPAAFAGPAADLAVQYLYGAGAQYEDAKAKGASDADAENAALIGGLGAVPNALLLSGIASKLGKNLGGMTTTQVITKLAQSAALGGITGGEFQAYQNLTAQLAGYDPNRRLDQGVIQQAAMTAGLGALTEGLSVLPGYARYLRGADTEVRNKPGTAPPGETGPESWGGAAAPLAEPPAVPLETAAQVAQRTAGALRAAPTPEAVLAAAGTPQEALENELHSLSGITEPAPAPGPPPSPGLQGGPAPAPVVAVSPEVLQAGRQEAARELERGPGPQEPKPTPIEQQGPEPQPARAGTTPSTGGQVAQGLAALTGAERVAEPATQRPEPLTQREVKAETNRAATAMGLDQVVHYVPDAESLPERVKKTLTEGERNNTAQTVWDNSMRDLWVIGDRFTSREDLQRALIEETQGRIWNDVSDLKMIHDPSDPRLGHYDIAGDRPVLNTAALLRTDDPFTNASKAALEEINVHQGFSKLLGPREGQTYVDAMNAVQRQFDRLQINDDLARAKGFRNLEQMAKAYGFEDYASNPRHQHALTEELAGAYAQRFGTREAIEQSAPRWWQSALQNLSDGIRRRLGIETGPVDIGHLLNDSMAALRKPKFGQDTTFHPEIGEAAKTDMFRNQLANLRGDSEAQADWFKQWADAGVDLSNRAVGEKVAQAAEPPPLPQKPPGPPEPQPVGPSGPRAPARVGDVFVKPQLAEVRAGLTPDQGMRQQVERMAMQQGRPFSERMALARDVVAVYDKRSFERVMAEARAQFQSDYGGDIHYAMQRMLGESYTDAHTALRKVVNEETNRQIDALKARNLTESAWSLEHVRDRFNEQMAPKVTEIAQALNAQKLFYEDGPSAIGRLRAAVGPAQKRIVEPDRAANRSFAQIGAIMRQTASQLIGKNAAAIEGIQERMNKLFGLQQSLADRYINALATSINDRMAQLGFNPEERPALQELFNRFQSTINQMIRERMVPPPTPEMVERLGATATIREALSNLPMFERAWDETLTRLKTENPNALFFSKLDNALQAPLSARAVSGVVREAGYDLRQLIYNHFTTQERIGNELANSLVQGLGLDPFHAMRVQNAFNSAFRDLLAKTQGAELQAALDRVGAKGTNRPAEGELERLTQLMSIGALNKDEYNNLLAPRFGLGSWNPEVNAKLGAAGEVLQQIRDEGGPEVFKNQKAAEIADLIARNQPALDVNVRRAEALWMSSLLTGPFTHGSYYAQNLAQVMTNLALRTLRTPADTGTLFAAIGDMFNSMVHALPEAKFILQTGIHTQRELPGAETAGMRGEGIPPRSALEATPLPGEMRNPLNWYRYVGRFLQGAETVFYRGAQAAITRSLAIRLADERGLSSADGIRFAEQVVYGTENDRNQAIAQAAQEQARFGFSDAVRDRRVQELIDQKRFERIPELADQAHRFALHSVYREAPYGMLGTLARKLNEIRADNPAVSLVTPFISLPANVANEFMNWTPIGLWRGRDALGSGTGAIKRLYADVPGFERLVEAGATGPGGIGNRELRDLAYEYMAKGVIGSLGILTGIGMAFMNRNNPNAFFAVNGAGPTNIHDRDALRAGGCQPYSIKVGDRYFSYEASPWKAALGMIGGAHDLINYSKHFNPENFWGDVTMSAFRDAANSVTDSSFLQGLQTVLGASSTRGTDAQNLVERFISQTSSGLAGIFYGGTGARQIYKVFNPQNYEAKGLGQMIVRNIPGLNSALLRPSLNVLGEPVTSSPWNRLIIGPTVENQDPVWRFIDEGNIHLSFPGASTKVGGVQLSPDEMHDFVQERGLRLREMISAELGAFQGLDAQERNIVVREMEAQASAVAKERIAAQREQRR